MTSRGGAVNAAAPAPVLARSPGMTHHKLTLPSKICAACGRPFAWRRKWARDWEQLRYCSDRCRRAGPPAAAADERR